jgi:hypothetical protein
MPEDEKYSEYESMDNSELLAVLTEQKKLLVDMEEQLVYLLHSTGHHIGGTYRRKRELEAEKQRALVALLKDKLENR